MITILDENFSKLNETIEKLKPSQIIFLVDSNTHEFCLPILLENLETDIPFEIVEIEPGEALKNIETSTQLWEILAEFKTDRKSLMINLGGGVITDLGGFVASTYKRGIPFINIPTTLLAMCDASIGGKTGIDHLFLKNIVGTFSNALEIMVYPDFLKTLSFHELRSGFAEMLKHGLISDAKHWQDLIHISEISSENISPYILKSMEIKNEVVLQDFDEQNVRKILNFGHTIGHAIESLFLEHEMAITHGEAVVMGMICETHLSFLENLIEENTANTIINELGRFYPKLSLAIFSEEKILSLMQNDKKNVGRNINFTLIKEIGKAVFDQKVSEKHIALSLHYYQNLA